MKTERLQLLPFTESSSGAVLTGERFKGVGYYNSSASLQTLIFDTNDFVGKITVQASLDTNPENESQWFDVYVFPGDSTQDGSTAITTVFSTSVTGNFVWLRAVATGFIGGTINEVKLVY